MNLVPIHAQTFQNFVIHAETGTVFAKKYEGEISRLNEKEYHNTIEKIAKKFVIENNDENFIENMKRAQKLIDYDIQFMPTKTQLDILDAHHYLKKGTGDGIETVNKLLESTKNVLAADTGLLFVREKASDPSLVKNI